MLKLSTGRKAFSALAVAVALGAAMTPMSASAKGWKHHHGHGYGYGAAALAGGLILGAIAANAAERSYVDRECWTERRKSYDGYGGVYIRKIRVCD